MSEKARAKSATVETETEEVLNDEISKLLKEVDNARGGNDNQSPTDGIDNDTLDRLKNYEASQKTEEFTVFNGSVDNLVLLTKISPTIQWAVKNHPEKMMKAFTVDEHRFSILKENEKTMHLLLAHIADIEVPKPNVSGKENADRIAQITAKSKRLKRVWNTISAVTGGFATLFILLAVFADNAWWQYVLYGGIGLMLIIGSILALVSKMDEEKDMDKELNSIKSSSLRGNFASLRRYALSSIRSRVQYQYIDTSFGPCVYNEPNPAIAYKVSFDISGNIGLSNLNEEEMKEVKAIRGFA